MSNDHPQIHNIRPVDFSTLNDIAVEAMKNIIASRLVPPFEYEKIARDSYGVASAMIKERNKLYCEVMDKSETMAEVVTRNALPVGR